LTKTSAYIKREGESMSSFNWKILFNETQKERGRLALNYRGLKGLLEEAGFQCIRLVDSPITEDKLEKFDIFVIPCPDQSKFNPSEIDVIVNFVSRGGGLLIMSHAGGDPGLRTNLNSIAEKFGISFQNNQVTDERQNFVHSNMPKITRFSSHPITQGINEICYPAGCSLKIVGGNAEGVAFASKTAEPPEAIVAATAEFGAGKVVALGSYEIFRDRTAGGLNTAQNASFALNIFNWLKEKKIVHKASPLRETKEERVAITYETPAIASLDKETITETPGITAYTPQLDKILMEVTNLRKRFDSFVNEFRTFAARMLSQKGGPSIVTRIPTETQKEQLPPMMVEEIEELEGRLKSLKDQLEYITMRYQAGAIEKAEYAVQRSKLRGEIRTIIGKIKALKEKAGIPYEEYEIEEE
ncbi:MAG: hypothetical protein QXF77_08160, partial [Candidatus Jordarchaeales archaeon]